MKTSKNCPFLGRIFLVFQSLQAHLEASFSETDIRFGFFFANELFILVLVSIVITGHTRTHIHKPQMATLFLAEPAACVHNHNRLTPPISLPHCRNPITKYDTVNDQRNNPVLLIQDQGAICVWMGETESSLHKSSPSASSCDISLY